MAKIVLQVLSNILKQFFEDVIMFLSKLIFRGPKTKFELNSKNYAEAALEAILDYFKPFSKMKRALSNFILSTLKTMAGQIVDCIRGKPFDIGSIINETFVSALKSLVLGNADKKIKKELEYLRQHCDDIDEVLYLENVIKTEYSIREKKYILCIDIPKKFFDIFEKITDIHIKYRLI